MRGRAKEKTKAAATPKATKVKKTTTAEKAASKTSTKRKQATKVKTATSVETKTKPAKLKSVKPSKNVKKAVAKKKADQKEVKKVKDLDYMNESHKEHFRAKLLEWKKQLMEEVDRTVHHMQDVASNDPDPADRATQEEEFSLELRTRDRERKLIKKIDSTIDLLDTDEYGYCESCGIEIGLQRLEARPTATQCIDCKTLD